MESPDPPVRKIRRHPVEVVVLDANQDADVLEQTIKSSRAVAVIAAPRAKELEAQLRLARRRRLPFLVTTPWEPTYSLDPRDPVIHVGGNAVDPSARVNVACRMCNENVSPGSTRRSVSVLIEMVLVAEPAGIMTVLGAAGRR